MKPQFSLDGGHMFPKIKPILFALAACVMFSGGAAHAAYPDRIIKIVVPFAPGGGTDVVARTLAQEMSKDLGVTGPSSAPRRSRPPSPTATRC
jgi:hypothetical protein